MASQSLKHRPQDEPTITTPSTTTMKNRKVQKLAIAKRGLHSLTVAITVPFILTTLTTYISGAAAAATSKPFWHLPVWVFYLASISTSCLMGLSAWLVWAEGGFHHQPTTLPLFVAQFLLGLVWGPLVFWLHATRVGLMVCIVLFATLFICSQSFHQVNPIAGDLVKPSLAWVSFLAMFNYKLI
ncbi:translocator protein homolog [Elaeis guineensis]|uniref:Translocator protein homolog n=1 Tax=Elaeis guineensis var. tenera TaxID=51953 RepID=A0A6I9QS72_ELAGV|nr:translocator protein homolog [Elaeis guineensis]